MLEDQTRLGVLDHRTGGEVLEDEVVQSGRVSGRDVQQVVRSSGNVKHLDHARQVRGNGDEGLDLVAVVCLHADGNDGLYGQAHSGQVDVRVITANDAAFAQGPNAPETGRRSDPH